MCLSTVEPDASDRRPCRFSLPAVRSHRALRRGDGRSRVWVRCELLVQEAGAEPVPLGLSVRSPRLRSGGGDAVQLRRSPNPSAGDRGLPRHEDDRQEELGCHVGDEDPRRGAHGEHRPETAQSADHQHGAQPSHGCRRVIRPGGRFERKDASCHEPHSEEPQLAIHLRRHVPRLGHVGGAGRHDKQPQADGR